jgi:3-oxoadipate enol-lactonase
VTRQPTSSGGGGDGPPGYGSLPTQRALSLRSGYSIPFRFVEGPPGARTLLLLHGLTSTADLCWFAAFERLGRTYRLVAPDLRGHGEAAATGKVTMDEMAADMSFLLGALGIESAVAAGYSMGGVVAQCLWRRRPELLEGLVLCATAADFRPESPAGWAGLAARASLLDAALHLPASAQAQLATRIGAAGVRRTSARALAGSDPVQDWARAQLQRNDPLGVLAATVALRRTRTTAWVKRIKTAVALVIPTEDAVVPVGRQRALAASLPLSEVFELHGGHGVFVEDPESFAGALSEAVDSVVARAAGN